MSTGAITPYIDVAQIVLYMFWIFFAGLIYYLHRENKREGYPLESDTRGGRVVIQGFPAIPEPKTFRMSDGTEYHAPGANSGRQPRPVNAESHGRGNPISPTGNPLLAGVGPGAWAERANVVDTTLEGGVRIVPLRAVPDHHVAAADIDPRGLPIYGADHMRGGTVVDLWVDRSEALFRYLEVEVPAAGGTHRVLVPMTLVKVRSRFVDVQSILGKQFAEVPTTAQPEQVTRREEDRICAYYGAGTLYATPSRQEPLL